jgi:hypothetical protein
MESILMGEIDKATGLLVHVAEQPFLPVFGEDYHHLAVDLTGLDPMPEVGWVWQGGRGFLPPEPGEPGPPEEGAAP